MAGVLAGREALKECCRVDENLLPRRDPAAPRPPAGTIITRTCKECGRRHHTLFAEPINLLEGR